MINTINIQHLLWNNSTPEEKETSLKCPLITQKVTRQASQPPGLHIWIWFSPVNCTKIQFPRVWGTTWQQEAVLKKTEMQCHIWHMLTGRSKFSIILTLLGQLLPNMNNKLFEQLNSLFLLLQQRVGLHFMTRYDVNQHMSCLRFQHLSSSW